MPKYVVTDSKNTWLEAGEFDTPEEAVKGGLDSGDFDAPSKIYVYEVIGETQFLRDTKGKYIRY